LLKNLDRIGTTSTTDTFGTGSVLYDQHYTILYKYSIVLNNTYKKKENRTKNQNNTKNKATSEEINKRELIASKETMTEIDKDLQKSLI
jgi:hypothetical protein